jgi:hypothetical protein
MYYVSPHRLAAQDGALSRLKQGFESPWGHVIVFILNHTNHEFRMICLNQTIPSIMGFADTNKLKPLFNPNILNGLQSRPKLMSAKKLLRVA